MGTVRGGDAKKGEHRQRAPHLMMNSKLMLFNTQPPMINNSAIAACKRIAMEVAHQMRQLQK